MADSKNDRVRVISAGTSTDFGAPMTDGGIVTIMGGGTRQTEGSTPLDVDLSPDRVAVDGRGDLVVSDDGSERIWVLAGDSGTLWGQSMTAGDAYFVAGGNTNCASYTASGAATSAYLCDPAGVVVDPTGDIDVASPEINRIFTIGNALAVTTTSLPGGTVGTSYSEGLTAVGGPTPFDWTITTGALPPGLNLNPAGTISGTPTAGGLYSFTVEATDSDRPATVGDAGAVDGRPAVRHVHHHHRGRQRREDGYDDHGRLVAHGDGGGAALRGDGRPGGQHRLHRRQRQRGRRGRGEQRHLLRDSP